MTIIFLSFGLLVCLMLAVAYSYDNKRLRREIAEKDEQLFMLSEIMQDPEKLANYNKYMKETFDILEEARIKYGAEYVK